MAIWPFNRKQSTQDPDINQDLPKEIQEYYESGRKQRTGMAWLLALATLLVTVAVAILLFFGGRWVFQQFSGDDEPTNQPTSQTENQDESNQEAANTPATPGASDESDDNDDQQGSSSTNTTIPSAADDELADTTPGTGSSGSEIPDTGPGPGGLQ